MKRIHFGGKIHKNKHALVDDEDYEYINQWRWRVAKGYAARQPWNPKTKKLEGIIFMHRVINQTPINLETDHINGNKLDNRKSNLRSVSRDVNALNQFRNKDISLKIGRKHHYIDMRICNNRLYIGKINTKEEALHIKEHIKQQVLEILL